MLVYFTRIIKDSRVLNVMRGQQEEEAEDETPYMYSYKDHKNQFRDQASIPLQQACVYHYNLLYSVDVYTLNTHRGWYTATNHYTLL